MKLTCAGCGVKFRPERKNQRSCSAACRKLAYERSAKAGARKKRYEASEKGGVASEKYAATAKGKARYLRHYYRDRPDDLRTVMKNRTKWTKDVHRYAEKHGLSLFEALRVLDFNWVDGHDEALKFLKWDRSWDQKQFVSRWYWKLWWEQYWEAEQQRRTSGDIADGTIATSTTDTLPGGNETERRASGDVST